MRASLGKLEHKVRIHQKNQKKTSNELLEDSAMKVWCNRSPLCKLGSRAKMWQENTMKNQDATLKPNQAHIQDIICKHSVIPSTYLSKDKCTLPASYQNERKICNKETHSRPVKALDNCFSES